MDNNKEIVDSLKSTFNEKFVILEGFQAEGVKALEEHSEALKSEDAGRISEASEKLDAVGAEIKSAQEELEAIQEQMGWFKEYSFQESPETKSQAKEELRQLFEDLRTDGTLGGNAKSVKKTAGQYFADLLKYRGINSSQAAADLRAETSAVFHFGEFEKPENTGTYKNIKSLYSNNGETFVDGDPVPGFMGVQCGLVEDRNIYCLLDPPADDFEECLTRESFTGNRIRYNYEAARDSAAASVLETIYNPYPDFAQDGTKPEGSFTIGTATESVKKIAEFITASDEVLEDCSFVASMIDHVLQSNLNAEKRRQLIAGNGTTEMRGILNQPNLLERTHGDVADGGDPDDNVYDTFRRSLTDIWLQNGSTDSICAIVHPRELESVDLLKDGFGRYLFNDSECFSRMLRCIRMRTSVDMPEGTAVLGNFANNWVFFVRKQLEIRMGYTGDQFITNTNTILGEMRGMTIVRCPRKIIKINGLPAGESPS
jgi:hypothetical protein